MKELSLHLLDLAENSAAAGASRIEIEVFQSEPHDFLRLSISDDGRGMPPELLAIISDPFVTSRTTRKVGLGIPLLKAAAEACNGCFNIDSVSGQGTQITAEFQLSHIDRMPLGDIGDTFFTLLVAHPEINWRFRCQVESNAAVESAYFDFDSTDVKAILGEVPLSHPDVLSFLNRQITEGVGSIAYPGQPGPVLA